jgi:hypothetical protein
MSYPIAIGDESGETGFRFGNGSTDYFVFSLVFTDDAERLRDQIHWVRHKLGWLEREEISFNKTSNERRAKFFESLQPLHFVVRSLVVDKRRLGQDARKLSKHQFYGFFVAELLACLPPGELDRTTLVLDRFNGESKAIHELKRNLTLKNVSGVQRITTRRSDSEILVQLADMCAGAILREVTTGQSFHVMLKARWLTWRYGE